MRYQLSLIAKVCEGRLIGADRTVEQILTDSRHSGGDSESLFVAMSGRNHDSHRFVGEMLHRGVLSFIVESESAVVEGGSFVVVRNSIEALQRLAAFHRSMFSGRVVAIVGSNGKTVVKEWAAQSLSGCKSLFRSPRSYNSQLGVALSLLMASGDEQILLIEAGVSQCGEMELLEAMIRPDVVVVSSIGDAHQEGFDSLEQKVEQKMKIASAAKTVIYHSAYTPLVEYFGAHTYKYNLVDASAKQGGGFAQQSSQRNSQIVEALLDECGVEQGCDLSSLPDVAMRLELREGLNGSVVINDSYNNCVNSLSIAIDTLNSVAAGRPTTLILSPILQSGVSERQLYAQVERVVKGAGIDRLICVGGGINRWIECDYFESTEQLLSRLSRDDYAHRAILLKGNRSSRFERVSHAIEHRSHTTTLEVDLDAMVSNLNYFRSKIAPGVKLIAMVKASSYGAGDYEVAQTLQGEGVDYLAVAFVDEGVALRERGVQMPIIVLNADDDSFDPMIDNHLEPEIYSLRSLNYFVEAVERRGEVDYPIHIKIDSGMHRLGFEVEELEELSQRVLSLGGRVRVASIFSHLSQADEPTGVSYTERQVAIFRKACDYLTGALGYSVLCHIANSAAIDELPQAHFDAVRLGIGLYGFGVSEEHLQPISTLKSRIVQIKRHAAGSAIGYGGATVLQRESLVATVPIGYADGLRRELSCGRWSMLTAGVAAPIVGRICMDSVMIDVTDVEGVAEGDSVTIFSSLEGNRASDMAKILGTIPYEILTSISRRVKRVYLKE